MRSRVVAGAVAGLAAGVIAAASLSVMSVLTPEGRSVRVITLVAHSVESDSFAVGWLVQLVLGAVIGALFGALFAGLASDPGSAAALGSIYGLALGVVGWLVVMPLTHGLKAFAPVTTNVLRQLAIAGLFAYLAYGAVLGGIFPWLFVKKAPRS